jgi:hypothetical protein
LIIPTEQAESAVLTCQCRRVAFDKTVTPRHSEVMRPITIFLKLPRTAIETRGMKSLDHSRTFTYVQCRRELSFGIHYVAMEMTTSEDGGRASR